MRARRFYKMIFAVRKRFDGEAKPLRDTSATGPTNGAADENGTTH